MNYKDQILAARKRIRSMQDSDARAGVASPEDLGAAELVKTAMFAIEAGIATNAWDCIADAQVMLHSAAKELGIEGVDHIVPTE